jgi:hypothetical protein
MASSNPHPRIFFVIGYFFLRHCEERSDEAISSRGDDPRYGNEIASLRSQ